MKKKATTIFVATCAVVVVAAAGFGGYSVGRGSTDTALHATVATLPENTEGVVVGGVGSISIPGFDRITFKAGQTAQNVTLYNPETNDCVFVIELVLPSGKTIYCSGELAPGESVDQIEISDPLDAAIYESSTLRYTCYTLGEDPQELNGADSNFTLEVLP